MMQLFKIIFIFFLLLAFCQSLGLFLNDKLKLGLRKHYFFAGLIAIFGIYELLMIFPLVYNLSSIYSYISGLVVLLICLYSLYVERKKVIISIIDKNIIHIVLLICLTVILFFITGNAVNNFNDTFFYESFIVENTKSATLNYVNMYQSGYIYISPQYSFDAYYHFLALLSNVFRVKPYLLITWLMPFIYSVFYFSSYAEIIEHFCFSINKKLLILPIYVLTFISLFNNFDLPYVGNFYNPPILSIIILFLSKKELSKKQSLFIAICFVAGISTQSTFIIYSIIIVVAKAFHIVITKEEKQISNMCIYMCPVIFFSLLTFIKTFGLLQSIVIVDVVVGFVSIGLMLLLKKTLNIKSLKICCIVFSVLIYIASIFLIVINQYKFGPQDFIGSLDLFGDGFDYIKIIIELIPLLIIVIKDALSKNYDYYFVLVVTTIILFFNPLTISCVSTYMTNEVYGRIFNICTSFIIVVYAVSLVKNTYSYILILLFIVGQKTYNTEKIELYNRKNDYLLYRMSYDSYNAFTKLDELTQQYKKTTGYPPSTFTTDLRSEFITNDAGNIYNLSTGRIMLMGDKSYYQSFREEQICDLYAALTKDDIFENPEYISSIISNQVIKYILIDSDQSSSTIEEIEKCCRLDYQNNSYLLYSCNQK